MSSFEPKAQAVDLEEHDPRRVRDRPPAGAACDPLDDSEAVGVVVVRPQHHVEYDADGRGRKSDTESRPERAHRESSVGDPVRCEQNQRVEDQDQDEANEEHQRQPQGRDDRRQHCVQDGDHSDCGERSP